MWRKVAIGIATVGLLPNPVRAQSSKASSPPSIVYIMADDLGWGELGSYGQTKIRTPALDRLAREGMRLTQFYSGSPVCAPSRATFLTGRHTGHAPIRGNAEYGGFRDDEERGQHPLPIGTPTIATLLKARGYATALIGKWGLGGPQTASLPTAFGFDHFYGYLDQKQAHNHYPSHLWRQMQWDTLQPYFAAHQPQQSVPTDSLWWHAYQGPVYAPDRMTDEALAFIRSQRDRPFFLYLAFTLPHLALQVPDEELAPYQFPETPYLGTSGYLPHPRPRAAYAGMIARLDRHVGQVLALLDSLGLSRSTLVVFTSDNGTTYTGGVDPAFFRSTGGLRGLKDAVYEGGIRVPFIARWPGHVPPGAVRRAVLANWDVFPTVAEIAGASPGSPGDGVSFARLLQGGRAPTTRPPLYWEHHGVCAGQQAVRDGRWKLVRLGVGAATPAPPELYDLEADPGEGLNLASRYPAIVQRLTAVAQQRATAVLDSWNFPVDSARRVDYASCAPGRSLTAPAPR